MKIVLNSDVIYANSLIKNTLPKKLADFIDECKKHNHIIVIPLTTLFEFDNKQLKFLEDEKNKIIQAVETLKSYEIQIQDSDINEVLNAPDLIKLIKDTGISCILEEPTNEDFKEAHRKACFHLSPHPPEKKSDEMRDLVIWEIAIRIANEEQGSLLISNDELHTHHRGDQDASTVKLLRFNNFERAMEALDIETPSAKEIKQLLDKVWNEMVESDLPLENGASINSIKKPRFMNDEKGVTHAKASLKFNTGNGKELSALMEMSYIFDIPKLITLREILIDSSERMDSVTIELSKIETPDFDYKQRLKDLRELF